MVRCFQVKNFVGSGAGSNTVNVGDSCVVLRALAALTAPVMTTGGVTGSNDGNSLVTISRLRLVLFVLVVLIPITRLGVTIPSVPELIVLPPTASLVLASSSLLLVGNDWCDNADICFTSSSMVRCC